MYRQSIQQALIIGACLLPGLSVAAPTTEPTMMKRVFAPKAPRGSSLGKVEPKIVGGAPALQNDYRWITSLQYFGSHFCGGALIGDRWVLTAAHCTVGETADGEGFSVWVGGHDLTKPGSGVRRDVVEIINHPAYDDFTLKNDIALLRLSAPVNANIPRVSIPSAAIMGQAAAPNMPVRVSGWGALSEGGSSPNVLHEVSIPVVSNATCNAPSAYAGDIENSQICAGLKAGSKDSCQGDSGGPLWVRYNGQDYHVGVVSFGDGCARPDKYGVYTRTSAFNTWIANTIGTNTGPAPQPGPTPQPNPGDGQCSAPPQPGQPSQPVQPPQPQPPTAPGGGNSLQLNEVLTGLSGAVDETEFYSVYVPANSSYLWIEIWGGQGDADLYVARGRKPTTNDYDFAPYLDGNAESVYIEDPQPGIYHIMIHGYEGYQNLRLTAESY